MITLKSLKKDHIIRTITEENSHIIDTLLNRIDTIITCCTNEQFNRIDHRYAKREYYQLLHKVKANCKLAKTLQSTDPNLQLSSFEYIINFFES